MLRIIIPTASFSAALRFNGLGFGDSAARSSEEGAANAKAARMSRVFDGSNSIRLPRFGAPLLLLTGAASSAIAAPRTRRCTGTDDGGNLSCSYAFFDEFRNYSSCLIFFEFVLCVIMAFEGEVRMQKEGADDDDDSLPASTTEKRTQTQGRSGQPPTMTRGSLASGQRAQGEGCAMQKEGGVSRARGHAVGHWP